MASDRFKYGSTWNMADPLRIEMGAIILGGKWKNQQGQECGQGLFHHYKQAMRLLWPGDWWTRWDDMMLDEMIKATFLGISGPASSGKTHTAAKYGLVIYWCFPEKCTVLCSTTTREMLELRIWGEIKKYFRIAKDRFPWLDGVFIESRQQITTDGKEVDGREFRNGIKGVACKTGGVWEGLQNYIGLKNDIVILIADESMLMHTGFFDSAANLASNPKFQLIALGNPNDPSNSFGKLCEPEDGWDTFVQGSTTQTWKTRFRKGKCLRLVGTDSPNLDRKDGLELYPKLIGRRYIEEIASTYGTESWQYLMWVLAKFPTNILERRVITRAMCIKFGAFEPPVWSSANLTRLFAMDAAYGAVGGDRCVGGEFAFGRDVNGQQILALIGKPILIPVAADKGMPEDQIALWVKNYCEEREITPGHVFFDGTGRSSLTSSFARRWSAAVNPLEFGGRATDRPCPADPRKTCRDMYGKFVSELWFTSRTIIEAGQFRGMTEEIASEGQLRAWSVTTTTNARAVQDVEKKEDTKKRLGKSPDLYDMLVSGMEGARRLGFQIAKLDLRGQRSSSNALKELHEQWKSVLKSRELRAV